MGKSASDSERTSSNDNTEVRPVYPAAEIPPHPLAVSLCEALHDVPVARLAECCRRKPGVVLTSECVRNLSSALGARAVTVEEAAVVRCKEAIRERYAGCDWPGPLSLPPPDACRGVIHGTLKSGSRCRSSLECDERLYCLGVGPTDPGICAPPSRSGSLCGTAVDTLAVYTRQDDYDESHPACQGFCDKNRCFDSLPEGAPCASNAECGRGRRCKDTKCTPGARAASGESCLGGECEVGLRCDKHRCVLPGSSGAPCTVDAECRAACVRRDGGVSGTCGPRC